MESTRYRLAIIEDKPVVLDSLVEYFSNSESFNLIIKADSFECFLASWSEQHIDLLLCDINLIDQSGVAVTWYVKSESPSTQIVIFTVFDDKETIFQALRAGASDYLSKNTPLRQVEDRMMEVLDGGSGMGPQVARMILEYFEALGDRTIDGDTESLTPREKAIVSRLKQGDSNKQIAEKFSVSVGTIRFHIRNVYGKLQINSRPELMQKYKRLG